MSSRVFPAEYSKTYQKQASSRHGFKVFVFTAPFPAGSIIKKYRNPVNDSLAAVIRDPGAIVLSSDNLV